jgi:uncharacterized ferritin-like protein (DUF455 family)
MRPVEVARPEDAEARVAEVEQFHFRVVARRHLRHLDGAYGPFTDSA